MTTETQGLPGLPAIPNNVSSEAQAWMRQVTQVLQTMYGQGKSAGTNSRFVTIQDLVDAGVVANGVIK